MPFCSVKSGAHKRIWRPQKSDAIARPRNVQAANVYNLGTLRATLSSYFCLRKTRGRARVHNCEHPNRLTNQEMIWNAQ